MASLSQWSSTGAKCSKPLVVPIGQKECELYCVRADVVARLAAPVRVGTFVHDVPHRFH